MEKNYNRCNNQGKIYSIKWVMTEMNVISGTEKGIIMEIVNNEKYFEYFHILTYIVNCSI